jgi:type I restriction enzyme, S subunit
VIEGLKPYPRMKDSGMLWLGEVPEHWQVRRLKYLLRERDDRSVDGSQQLLRVSQYTGITERRRDDGGTEPDTRAESLAGYKLVDRNDLAINIMLAWNGSMGVSPFRGIVSPAYCVYRIGPQAHPWYLHHLLRSPSYKARIKAVSTGVVESRLRLYTDDLYRLEALLPPRSEQAGVVRFLEYADQRIRRYIRAKQKLIKLLEKQKEAIIHRAVTRGLDPNVPLKPSSLEWLGDVPEHWEVRPLKFLTPQVTVGIVIQPARLYVASGVPCLRSLNISSGIIQARELVFITPESNREHHKSQIFSGDIVVVRTGRAGVAAVVTPEFDGANCIDLLIVRASERFYSEYLLMYLNSWAARTDIEYRSVGAIQAHYNTTTLANLVVPVPPLEDQRAIIDVIARQTSPLDRARVTADSEIALLGELRTRLIADVVTGKLDVREGAARLPDEVDEAEPLDEIEPEAENEEAADGETDEVLEIAEA